MVARGKSARRWRHELLWKRMMLSPHRACLRLNEMLDEPLT